MNKCLDLHILRDMRPDLPDLLKREFPCRHDTFRAQSVPEKTGFIIGVVRLCADVAFNLRADLPGVGKNSRIRYDQSVRLQFFQLLQIFPHSGKISVMSQDIDRHIYFHPMRMGEGDPFRHILMRKILRFCPKSEGFSADIYRIRAENHSDLQDFQTAGRHQ